MVLVGNSPLIYEEVQKSYGIAATTSARVYGSTVAKAFGYSEDELANTPQDANLGLSCGNPFAIANLQEGETVIDLGSGAGFDVFLAAKKVGVTGKVWGVDMNKDMLAKANRNKEITKADNVSFNESPITQISLPDATAHCIISNCVINLVPETEKQLVFNEMYRLLKPGGRVAISDILVKRPLPEELKNNVALYVGCISGASLVQDYEKYLKDAGFSDTLIVDTKNDLNVYKTANPELGRTGCCVGPSESGCGSKKPKAEPTKDARKHPLDNSSESLDFNEWAGEWRSQDC
ncbi:MAG: hypothetical protein LQ350_008144 [Teloschistes chrysophthalmus]|nr:MAG: hypothetical protein LQ350_008144 [Niorma chrysophthalma]